MSILRLALAQINLTVGDIEGNAAKVKYALVQAREHKANIVLFPELTLAGYPPEDLLLKPGFASAFAEDQDQDFAGVLYGKAKAHALNALERRGVQNPAGSPFEDFEKALKLDPGNARAQSNLARLSDDNAPHGR